MITAAILPNLAGMNKKLNCHKERIDKELEVTGEVLIFFFEYVASSISTKAHSQQISFRGVVNHACIVFTFREHLDTKFIGLASIPDIYVCIYH